MAIRRVGLLGVFALAITALLANIIAYTSSYVISGTPSELTLEDYIIKGQRYLGDGRYSEAILCFTSASEIDANAPEILMGLGNAYAGATYFEQAEASYQKLIDLEGTNVDAWINLAETYLRQGKLVQAKNLLETAATKLNNTQLNDMLSQTEVPPPAFSHTSGSYEDYFLLELSNAIPGSTIYYTTDGTEPETVSENIYLDGIVISHPQTQIKAKAINQMGFESETVTLNFDIQRTPERIQINDYEMRNILSRQVGSSVDFYNYDLAQIRQLYVIGYDIPNSGISARFGEGYAVYDNREEWNQGNLSSLSGIEHCRFLKSLNIACQYSLDLHGLEGLQHLEELSLIQCGVTDISPLSNLKGIRRLSLGWNSINSVDALAGLINLEMLGLWSNDIQDISTLAKLDKLYYLDIADNQITNISVVQNMPLLNEIWMYGNQIRDISPLDGLKELRTIMMRNNPVDNYGSLQDNIHRYKRIDVLP